MTLPSIDQSAERLGKQLEGMERELTDTDQERYRRATSIRLTDDQLAKLTDPPQTFPQQKAILGIHWHPEFVPIETCLVRIDRTFPNHERALIIPTQHNVVNEIDGYAGVEIDCYAPEFNRKVQFLAHFRSETIRNADVFHKMLEHTYRYRQSQLFEYIDSILDSRFDDRVALAARETGVSPEVVTFVRHHVDKIKRLIEANHDETPPEMLRNKLLRNYFDLLRENYDDASINLSQSFLKAMKEIVKARFELAYFYTAREFIEEIRSLGGGIIVPHPEQFWPVLLCDWDVDGYEVWNPQSQEFTEFLVEVVSRQNKQGRPSHRRLLVTMGDDCHMGEKVKETHLQDFEKARREVGVQPAWDHLSIRKTLLAANFDRLTVIEEYAARLGE